MTATDSAVAGDLAGADGQAPATGDPTDQSRLSRVAAITRLGRTRTGRPLEPLADRLYRPMPRTFDRGWISAILITAVAGFLRFWHLSTPKKIIFDETYYAKDAYSLLKFGYNINFLNTPEGIADKRLNAGNLNIFGTGAEFVVHPDGSKWQIAFGEWLFGMNSFGWRFSSFVVGTLLVLVVIRLTRRLSRSTLIGGIAGVLLAFDGLEFVMSRIALLDIFMTFWMISGVAALVVDRDWARKRLAAALPPGGVGTVDSPGGYGRWFAVRPWRIVAGVCFGLAIGSKWDALWVVAAFSLLSWVWDLQARRAINGRVPYLRSLGRDAIPAFLSIIVVAGVVYLGTWTSWFTHDQAYDHNWAQTHPAHGVASIVPDDLRSFVQYQKEVYDFHTGTYMKNATHPYASNPGGWPVLARPIGFDAINNIKPGTMGCSTKVAPSNCVAVISANGTPLLWWGGVLALIASLVFLIGQRDWRFAVPVLGFFAEWLPWFKYADRTIFFFYAVAMVPFTVIALSLCLGKILGPPDRGSTRRLVGGVIVGAFVVLVVVNFAYMYPIYTDKVLSNRAWLNRMWLKSWI